MTARLFCIVPKFPQLGLEAQEKDRRSHGSERSIFGIAIAKFPAGVSLYPAVLHRRSVT